VNSEVVWIGVVVVLAAMTQAASGYGFSLVAAPAIELAGQATNGIRIVNLLSFAINLYLIVPLRREIRVDSTLPLAIPAVICTPIGAWLALHIDARALGIAVGVTVLVSAATLASGLRVAALRGYAGAALAGAASGTMNALSGVGGPTVALYTANADWPRARVIPNIQMYFLIINLTAILSLGLPKGPVTLPGVLLGATAIGLAVGTRYRHVMPEKYFRPLILTIAALGAIASIIRSAGLSFA
jgi:uncharacterized membrane protein YfcA